MKTKLEAAFHNEVIQTTCDIVTIIAREKERAIVVKTLTFVLQTKNLIISPSLYGSILHDCLDKLNMNTGVTDSDWWTHDLWVLAGPALIPESMFPHDELAALQGLADTLRNNRWSESDKKHGILLNAFLEKLK